MSAADDAIDERLALATPSRERERPIDLPYTGLGTGLRTDAKPVYDVELGRFVQTEPSRRKYMDELDVYDTELSVPDIGDSPYVAISVPGMHHLDSEWAHDDFLRAVKSGALDIGEAIGCDLKPAGANGGRLHASAFRELGRRRWNDWPTTEETAAMYRRAPAQEEWLDTCFFHEEPFTEAREARLEADLSDEAYERLMDYRMRRYK